MASPGSRPWYRLHLLTCLIVAVVVWALIDRQREERPLVKMGPTTYVMSKYGWPLSHMEPLALRLLRQHDLRGWQFIGNCMLWTLFVGATAFVCEAWLRSQRRTQFRIMQLLILTAILGVVMALMNASWKVPYRAWLDYKYDWTLITWSDLNQPLRWPLLFAITCTLYTLGWLALWLCRGAYLALAGARR